MYQPSPAFTCCIIGDGKLTLECAKRLVAASHTLVAIVTRNVELRRWALEQQIPSLDPAEDQQAFLARWDFDYLFSIINPSKVSDPILSLPKRLAINFHDAPLPRYAGLHVTAWAIIHQESQFGVTWHQMSTEFDAGAILKQVTFAIEPEETAFSLSVKCYQQGLEAFAALLDDLAQGTLAPIPQDLAQRTVFPRAQRPDVAAVVDWQRPAVEIYALIRGLSFSPDINPLALPKVVLADKAFVISEAALSAHYPAALPGTILSIDARGVTVATGEGAITLLSLIEACGLITSAGEVVGQCGYRLGDQLVNITPEQRSVIHELNKRVGQHDAYWLPKLLSAEPFHFAEQMNSAANTGQQIEIQDRFQDDVVAKVGARFPDADFCDVIVAFYYCFLDRLGAEAPFALGLAYPRASATVPEFDSLFTRKLPFVAEVDASQPIAAVIEQVVSALAGLKRQPFYARDLSLRNPALAGLALPVAVEIFEGELTSSGATGNALLLSVQRNGPCVQWQSNNALLADDAAATIRANFHVFLANAISDFTATLGSVALVSASVREKILQQWNNTQCEYDQNQTVNTLFAQQATQRPDAIALVHRNESITYAALDARANTVAAKLQQLGAKADTLVGVFMERSIDMVVGLLGILKAGAAYVPLDPGYPRDRIALMAQDADLATILTHSRLQAEVPGHAVNIILVDEVSTLPTLAATSTAIAANIEPSVKPTDLAYVIYTSGSTGKPKGVMIEHRNVTNFFVGMDKVLDYQGEPGVWLAVTSISFDISVLEIFWTLCRGFKVVLQDDELQAGAKVAQSSVAQHMDVGLFYFSSDAGPKNTANNDVNAVPNRYKLLMEGAKFADQNDFSSVWTPERHFHLFGGLYPNPSVTSAAIAAITSRIAIRAGSIVLPLHNPVRVVEEWSVVDNISGGRVGFSFASGWHANDFSLMPENFENRKQIMFDNIELVRDLWAGKEVTMNAGDGKPFTARVYPEPIQKQPPIWITTAGNVETFRQAGEGGFNILTNLLGQSIEDIKAKISAYREGRKNAGHTGEGSVTVMVHTFIGESVDQVRDIVRTPFCQYLKTSFDLVKMAPWAFPAFRQPSKSAASDPSFDAESLTDEDLDALLDHAFDRYFVTAGIFGTPNSCMPLIDQLKRAGVNEIACLIDFGVDDDLVLDSLVHLNKLRELSHFDANAQPAEQAQDFSIAAQIRRHQVTHFQCTPSMARILSTDPSALMAFKGLNKLLLGGEALPTDLAQLLKRTVAGDFINVYGPTETCIWSTSSLVPEDARTLSIGRPIANTSTYVLNDALQPVPVGVPGELFIGGHGVVRGYLGRPELTLERFIPNPFDAATDSRIYRTGDLVRYRDNAELEYIGRLDHQVKLRGYRIELGEIESLICADAQVHECVVSVQDMGNETQTLAAYIVPEQASADSSGTAQHWQSIWDETYGVGSHSRTGKLATEPVDPTLNISGWLDSYTGELHSREHMLDWVSATADRILELKPKRVLEIGCGTGMILYRVAPHCEHYVGVDFSSQALALIGQQLPELDIDNVKLVQSAADTLALTDEAPFDLVIINSVAQYFPSSTYFADVIEKALSLLVKDGQIFVGDVRSCAHLALFHHSLELAKAPASMAVSALNERVSLRQKEDAELLLDPEFFCVLQKQLPQITAIDVQLKRGEHHNEMSLFRYDVVLSKGSSRYTLAEESFVAVANPQTLDGLSGLLNERREAFVVRDIINARLERQVRAHQNVQSVSAADLLQSVTQADAAAVEPEQVYRLATDWQVQLVWAKSGQLDCFDAYFIPPQVPNRVQYRAAGELGKASRYCHEPVTQGQDIELIARIKADLSARLPEFMVPEAWVLLPALPLTPNGKIDRKALPKPEKRQRVVEHEFVAPVGDIEQKIASVLQDMLNLEKIGSHDNFMDLGANSLLIVQANNRLNQLLGIKVSLVSMYRFPTIATLAEYLQGDADTSQGLNRGQQRGEKRRAAAGRRQRTSTRPNR